MILGENRTDDWLIRLFSVYIALMPILQYYKSPLSIFNAGTFLCIVFLGAFLVKTVKARTLKIRKAAVIAAYLILLLVNYVLQVIYRDSSYVNGLTMNYARAIILVVTILLIGSQYFDENFAFKVLGMLLVASSFFMVIQIVGGLAGLRFTGTIPSLLTEPGYGVPSSRVSGFYMEPSHYAQSALLYICWSLYNKEKKTKKQIIQIGIVMIGIVLSTSGQGYILLAVALVTWYCQQFVFTGKISRQRFYHGIIIVIAICAVAALASQLTVFKVAVSHFSSENGILGSQGFLGRTWSAYLLDDLSGRDRWIGMGLGALKNVYMTGYNSYLYSFGYLSYLFFAVVIGQIWFSKKPYSFLFAVIFAIEIYISSVINPYYICFFMSFILGKSRMESLERGNAGAAQ